MKKPVPFLEGQNDVNPNVFKYIRNCKSNTISMPILLVKFIFLTYLNILGMWMWIKDDNCPVLMTEDMVSGHKSARHGHIGDERHPNR